MKLFTVHEPAGAGRDGRAAEAIVFVKDGLSWPALFFPVVWLLWHRLWLGLAIYALALGVLGGLLWFGAVAEAVQTLLFTLPNLWLWVGGNDLRRGKLARRGFRQAAAVLGRDREEAEQRFFAAWVRASAPAATPRGAMPHVLSAPAGPQVLGLFPEPGAAR